MKQWLGILLVGTVSLVAEHVQAGPVHTAGRAPLAIAEANGDLLTFGDVKGVLYWLDEAQEERAAAVRLPENARLPALYTGGLADRLRLPSGRPLAIVCTNSQSALFWAKRSPEHPAGLWEVLEQPERKQAQRCSMNTSGDYARIVGAQLEINQDILLRLPEGRRWRDLVAVDQRFLLVDATGEGIWVTEQAGSWGLSSPQRASILRLEEGSRLVGRAFGLLRGDGRGTSFAAIQGDVIGESQRLPAQPCEDGVVCGVSLAADGSWLVSGYWGHFLGQGQSAKRLNMPISTLQEHPVAIAHQSLTGRFVYLGGDDGDRGTLGESWQQASDQPDEELSNRWVVWTRRDLRAQQTSLLSVPLPRRGTYLRSSDGELDVQIWEGRLPEPIPAHWIAWEQEQHFAAIETPLVSAQGQEWWRQSLGLTAAHRWVAAAGVNPLPVHALVIDSGMDIRHPWLQALRYEFPGELPGNGRDDDDNGYVDDVWGYDFVDEDAVPDDVHGHGTHVAGLLLGQDPQGQSAAIAPNIRVTTVRALDRSGKSNSIDLLRALVYSANSGARIVNCSWGGGPDTQALRDGFAYLRSQAVQVISSAGNDRSDNDRSPQVPKKYPGVISVAAFDQAGRRADFSNYGRRSVAFALPGVDIESTLIGQSFGNKSGTSMAAPQLTAAWSYIYGILESRLPLMNQQALHAEVFDILCRTALRSGWEQQLQCGRLQFEQAVLEALQAGE